MDRRDQPQKTIVRPFEGGLTSTKFSPLRFDEATALWVTLPDQIAFHHRILPQSKPRKQIMEDIGEAARSFPTLP